ncbi:MAG: ABC transporter ATP-binding protein [Micrococcales bacterium]|nr:ABC transporter ATP-binding protein [Micrococcales bacterium]
MNGAGKSTLLNALCGGLPPSRGTVTVGGFNPYGRSERSSALLRIALMPQQCVFPGNMTALEVVEYLTWMRGANSGDARRRAAEALDLVGLQDRQRSRIRALSGGMVRRVALAQALASNADVLVLDEPSTGLDPEQRRTMVEMLGRVERSVLLSSHVMEDVVDICSRVLVLDSGRLLFAGSTDDLASAAPDGTREDRRAEAGFLRLVARGRGLQ